MVFRKQTTATAQDMVDSSSVERQVKSEVRILLLIWLTALLFYCFELWRTSGFYFLADGYIFLRYAENLAAGNGFVFNENAWSYGFSSIVWTLVLAILKTMIESRDVFAISAAVLGLVMYLSSGIFFWKFMHSLKIDSKLRIPVAAILLLWPFSGVAAAMSAMETGCYLLLFSATCVALVSMLYRPSARNEWQLGGLIALLSLCRVEGALMAFTIAAILIAMKRWPWRIFFSVTLTFGIWSLAAMHWFGSALPWSSRARLYGYIGSVFQKISLNSYLSKNFIGRFQLLPEIISTQFIAHPVVLLHCMLAAGIIFGTGLFFLIKKNRFSSSDRKIVFALTAYVAMNFAMYLLLQPLIMQRYLVTFFPISLIMISLLLDRYAQVFNNFGSRAATFAVLVISFSLTPVFHSYYHTGSAASESWAILLRSFSTKIDVSQARVAAEPLGLAGYYLPRTTTIVDLGGLIEPEILAFWTSCAGDLIPFPTVGGTCADKFAVREKAEFILSNANGFESLDRSQIVAGPDNEGRMILRLAY